MTIKKEYQLTDRTELVAASVLLDALGIPNVIYLDPQLELEWSSKQQDYRAKLGDQIIYTSTSYDELGDFEVIKGNTS